MKIRLEFPLHWGKSPSLYMSSNAWLKVRNNNTEAFADAECTQKITNVTEQIALDVEVPNELDTIKVLTPSKTTPTKEITTDWETAMADPAWKIKELKKCLIIFDNMVYELEVINSRPNLTIWNKFQNDEAGCWLFTKTWALVVYVTEKETFGEFHWHSNLVCQQKYFY